VGFAAGTQVQAENNSDFGVLGTVISVAAITVAAGDTGTDIEM